MYRPAPVRKRVLHRGLVAPQSHLSDVRASLEAYGANAAASMAWPLANLALGYPFQVNETVTVYSMWLATGGTAGGNFDLGIYDLAGNRLVSTGTTARTVNAHTDVTALTDTVLTPGHYYAMMAADGVENYAGWTMVAAGNNEAQGYVEATSSFVLPNPITLARTTRTQIPYFGLNFYSAAS